MKKITKRQTQIMEFIRDFMKENQYCPSTRDISTHFNFSVKAAHDHLHALENKGFLSFEQGKSRSLKILDPKFFPIEGVTSIPLDPWESEGNENGQKFSSFMMSKLLLSSNTNSQYIAISVKDDALSERGIFYKDIVVIDLTGEIKDGVVVLAESNDIKNFLRIYRKSEQAEFLAATNSVYPDIQLRTDIKILGTLSLLMRQFKEN